MQVLYLLKSKAEANATIQEASHEADLRARLLKLFRGSKQQMDSNSKCFMLAKLSRKELPVLHLTFDVWLEAQSCQLLKVSVNNYQRLDLVSSVSEPKDPEAAPREARLSVFSV